MLLLCIYKSELWRSSDRPQTSKAGRIVTCHRIYSATNHYMYEQRTVSCIVRMLRHTRTCPRLQTWRHTYTSTACVHLQSCITCIFYFNHFYRKTNSIRFGSNNIQGNLPDLPRGPWRRPVCHCAVNWRWIDLLLYFFLQLFEAVFAMISNIRTSYLMEKS